MQSGVVGIDTVIYLRLYGQMCASANGFGEQRLPACLPASTTTLSRQEQVHRLSVEPQSRGLTFGTLRREVEVGLVLCC